MPLLTFKVVEYTYGNISVPYRTLEQIGVQWRFFNLSAKNLYPRVKKIFLKITTICFIFLEGFCYNLTKKAFIFLNEALLAANPDKQLRLSNAKNFLGVAVLRELILPSTGSLHRN